MSNRKDLETGRLIFTCRCGFIDTGHANPKGPKALWDDLPRAEQRPFFVAGDDGLGAVRLVLMLTSAPRAIFSLSSIVCPEATALAAEFGREAHLLGERIVQHDPVWGRIAPELAAPARVWDLRVRLGG